MTRAFTFDASACSGCKACQAACQDRSNLPLGVLWRRVYEVGGGDWTRNGDTWTSTVYAYNLSMACNHCVHPKCAGVCPVDAYTVREDGIVLLDSSKCIGCGYCAWACPYAAPQFDRSAGKMSKCDLCYDNLDAGLPPACVAACPLRILELEDQPALEAAGVPHPVVFPMPVNSRTEPRLYIRSHPAAGKAVGSPEVLNREEIAPAHRRSPAQEELPLLAFTLLGQMAAGLTWFLAGLAFAGGELSTLPWFVAGASIGSGLLISFLHLGSPGNAWRVFGNLRKSWLSREILAALLFAASWALTTLVSWVNHISSGNDLILLSITGIAGAAMVTSMAEVYRLRMVPGWNSWRTKTGFLLSAFVLGSAGVVAGQVLTGLVSPDGQPLLRMVCALLAAAIGLELVLTFITQPSLHTTGGRIRLVFLIISILTVAALAVGLLPLRGWVILPLFALIVAEEVFGRWAFYSLRRPEM